MLHEFLATNREEILGRWRSKLAVRRAPSSAESSLLKGQPVFLDQLTEILRPGNDDRAPDYRRVAARAAERGTDLLRMGSTVGQVVQDYGSICQSVTELADERNLAITANEFKTFNRCLDDAVAEAVTSYEHERDREASTESGVAHLGFLAHEMRNLLMTSMLTFEALSKGSHGIHGSIGALHARSLRRMRALIDRTLIEVRLETGSRSSERISVAELIEEVEIVAILEANARGIEISADPGTYDLAVEGDHQILAAVIANLVQNAFKFTLPQGHIHVRAHSVGDRVLIEVEDQCGGLPPGKAENLFRPFDQRSTDKTGMGLGLTISLRGVEAIGGTIRVRDLPGSGCIFTIDLPRAEPTSQPGPR